MNPKDMRVQIVKVFPMGFNLVELQYFIQMLERWGMIVEMADSPLPVIHEKYLTTMAIASDDWGFARLREMDNRFNGCELSNPDQHYREVVVDSSACPDYYEWADAYRKATERRDALIKQVEQEERRQAAKDRLAALHLALERLVTILPGTIPCPKD